VIIFVLLIIFQPFKSTNDYFSVPTAVFEHGLGAALSTFEWIAQQLAGKYNMIMYDRAGNGTRP
jgi:pimeloyl-ACP methyl ester carboxylesterase